MATSFKRTYASMLYSVPLTLQQTTVNPPLHQRLWTLRQLWFSPLWGHCSFGPFSWVLVHITFCLCPIRVYFANPVEVL